MIALKIPDLKDFTAKLFLRDTFDPFLVSQASFITSIPIALDGTLHKDYFTDAEWEEMDQHDLARWSLLKPLCFQIIKGKRLPEQFKIVFVLSKLHMEKLLRESGLSIPSQQIGGLFLNIRYENNRLSCITGVSFSSFIMDKSLERVWDEEIQRFFKAKEILFEKL